MDQLPPSITAGSCHRVTGARHGEVYQRDTQLTGDHAGRPLFGIKLWNHTELLVNINKNAWFWVSSVISSHYVQTHVQS